MPTYSFLPLLILVLIVNVLWYLIKSILSENGYKVSYWSNHFRDIPNFKKLISTTENETLKKKYSRMLYSLIGSFLLIICYFIFPMTS